MKKPVRIIVTVLVSIVTLFVMLYAVLWIINGAMYGENRYFREYVCDVPEVNSGYAPQGISYAKAADGKEYYLHTGYDNADRTVLYVTEGNSPRRVYLNGEDGTDLIGHAGGIACTKDYVYIANGKHLHVYSLAAILAASGDTHAELIKSIPVDNNAAYVFSNDTHLYVGEFYRAGNYETDETHHYTTPNGDGNTAIVSCYTLDNDGLVNSTYPEYCISITGLVQGFATKNGVYILSRSYGLANSSLEYYSEPKDSGKTIATKFADETIEPKNVPLYYLDSSNLTRKLTLPSFSEDLTICGDRVVVTNESAANKYIVGKLFGGWKVYSYPIVF